MDIRRVRTNSIRLKKLFSEKTPAEESSVDRARLFFRRSPQEEYTFENSRILLNGVDVACLIDKQVDIRLWVGLAAAIYEYRKKVWSLYGTDWKEFNGQTQSLLEKLLNKLTHVYEETTGGVRVQFTGGRLWINDIDPKVVLALFLSNPTEERRRYLVSIWTKLALILEGKVGKAFSHGILEETRNIYRQIHAVLEDQAACCGTPLLAAVCDMGR